MCDLQMHLISLLKWNYKACTWVSCLLSPISTTQSRTKTNLRAADSSEVVFLEAWTAITLMLIRRKPTPSPKHLQPQQQPCSVPSVFQVVDHKRTPHGKIWFPCLRVQIRHKAIQIFLSSGHRELSPQRMKAREVNVNVLMVYWHMTDTLKCR